MLTCCTGCGGGTGRRFHGQCSAQAESISDIAVTSATLRQLLLQSLSCIIID
jgi:hypothetical protein